MSETRIDRLQPKHLSLIRSITELGQLSLAAQALALTQPAASRMLSEIERDVGSAIFTRTPKGMEPTAVGSALARRAQNVLEEMREAAREIDAIQRGLIGKVRVGAVTGGAVGYVVPAIQILKGEAETADLYVDVASSGELIRDLLSGQYDFVLGRIPSGIDSRQFNLEGGMMEEVELVVHQSHPLVNVDRLAIADMAHFPWVMQAPGTPLRQAVEGVFIEQGAPIPSNIVNTTSLLVMIAMLAASNAIAPMSREVSDLLCRQTAAAGLCSLKLEVPIVVMPYHLITVAGKRLSPIAARLRDLLLSEFSARGKMRGL
ncbi:LysR family transcriptional regulator [Rhizobium sp. CECT 9324]|jgi:DNA-binding transcriptional LysR family regulator|uniref:LysR family transcriptional regulator n=1 Tax=Rhizobium sp. CECT 9324 TaxID=2845820 RepID=UPI001E43A0F5|nr:LysR family transcriptional regulator [Rhizobium sp. CECT 9324]CAH0338674.1 HTH-type transcriptional regulator GbpR [Rhizobium sp. CECT 9324]